MGNDECDEVVGEGGSGDAGGVYGAGADRGRGIHDLSHRHGGTSTSVAERPLQTAEILKSPLYRSEKSSLQQMHLHAPQCAKGHRSGQAPFAHDGNSEILTSTLCSDYA